MNIIIIIIVSSTLSTNDKFYVKTVSQKKIKDKYHTEYLNVCQKSLNNIDLQCRL